MLQILIGQPIFWNIFSSTASLSPPPGSSRARQEERKQKLAKWKKQHSLTVEINKAPDEKSRYQLFMDHIARGSNSEAVKQVRASEVIECQGLRTIGRKQLGLKV